MTRAQLRPNGYYQDPSFDNFRTVYGAASTLAAVSDNTWASGVSGDLNAALWGYFTFPGFTAPGGASIRFTELHAHIAGTNANQGGLTQVHASNSTYGYMSIAVTLGQNAPVADYKGTYAFPGPGFPTGFQTDCHGPGMTYEIWLECCYMVAPTVAVTGPSGNVTTTSKPTVTWNFTGDELPQFRYDVKILRQSDNALMWSSQAISPSNSVVVGNALANNTTYIAQVQASTNSSESGVELWSNVSTSTFTIQLAAPGVPTAVTPVQSATVTTNTPVVGATLPQSTVAGATVRAEWQLATDSGFTANLKTVLESTADLRVSGATTEQVTVANKLSQTTWWIRCRTRDSNNLVSAFTTGQSFTVAHAPNTGGWSPTGAASVLYDGTNARLTWAFQDPSTSDVQTAYEVIVEQDASGAAVFSSGKVTSGISAANVPIPVGLLDVLLRWRVRVYDTDNVVGAFSNNNQFYARNAPAVAITQPANASVIDNPTKTVTWTFTATAGRTQIAYQVDIYDGATVTPAALVHTTGLVNSSALVYDFTLTGFRYVIGHTYTVNVRVIDSAQLQGSAVATALAQWTPPAAIAFTLDPAPFPVSGYVDVAWNPSQQDATFIQYNIYRRECGETTWVLIGTDTDASKTNSHYHDLLAPAAVCLEYTVTQLADRFGTPLESDFSPAQSVTVQTDNYWLVDQDTVTSLKLWHVVTDSLTDTYETAIIGLLARGRRVEYGTRYGYDGQLEVQLFDWPGMTARQQRLDLIAWKAQAKAFYLKNPFGDVLHVALGDMTFDRVPGVAHNEYGKMTIPYTEVSE